MSSITNSNSYFQLFNSTPESSTGNDGTTNSTSLQQLLLEALDGTSSSSSSSNSDSAYTLNLSQEAQSYLNGSSSSTSGSTSFTLTGSQKAEITSILDKYKDAPYTQATYTSIQSDLKAAGLDSGTLEAEDQVENFNGTAILIGDLSGNSDTANPSTSSSVEQTKASNYMQSIISQWQAISTTYSSSSSSED